MAIVNKKYAQINTTGSLSPDGHRELDAAKAYVTGSFVAAAGADIRNGSTQLLSASADQVTAYVDVKPSADASKNLGSAAGRWNNLFVKKAEAEVLSASVQLQVSGAADINGTLTVVDAFSAATAGVTASVDMKVRKILPETDSTYDLGADATRWANVYADALTVHTVSAEVLSASQHVYSEGDLVVQGTASIGGDFAVGANKFNVTALSGEIEAAGDAIIHGSGSIDGTLEVTDASDLHGPVTAYSTLNVQGATDLDSTLNVDEVADFRDVVYAHDDMNVSGSLKVALTANVAGNFSVATSKFTVASSSGDTTIAGDLMVSGDFTVMGDRIEAQISELRVEDGKITLMSGSTGRSMSNDAGIEVAVGSGNGDLPAISFASSLGGTSGSWVSNLDWIPSLNNEYDLGITSNKWRQLNLAGDANIGGAADVGSLSTNGNVSAGSIDSGDYIHAAGELSGSTLNIVNGATVGDGLTVTAGGAEIGGDVNVTGSLSSSLGLSGASLSVDGAVTADHVSATGSDSSFAGASFDGLAVFSGSAVVPSGESLTIDSGASLVVNGTATYGDLAATGTVSAAYLSASTGAEITGSLVVTGPGSLVVNGIDLTPISGAVQTDSDATNKVLLLSFDLTGFKAMKLELEVLAASADTSYGAGWKMSVAAFGTGTAISEAHASEITKETFGGLAPELDVAIETDGNVVNIYAQGAASGGLVDWTGEVTKKLSLVQVS